MHIDLPSDVMKAEITETAMDEEFPVPAPFEDLSGMLEAVKLLKDAERPMLLVGGGAMWANANQEVMKLAEMLMAPVATTMMGKGIIPEMHPLCMGMLGMHGREIARRAFLECDVMVAIGTRFSDRSSGLPSELPEAIKIIHLDIDPMEAGKNSHTKVRLVGDAKKGLQQIIKGLGAHEGRERLVAADEADARACANAISTSARCRSNHRRSCTNWEGRSTNMPMSPPRWDRTRCGQPTS